MLVHELLPRIKDVDRVVDVSPGGVDLRRYLMVPDEVAYCTAEPADVDDAALTPDTLLLAVVGPLAGPHTAAADLSPALHALPTGAKVLMLLGWTPEEFPYQLVLAPLVDGRYQVTDAVPVELSDRHGMHLALIAERVDELQPPRPYLVDAAAAVDATPMPSSDTLAAQLWATNQHLLGEMVAVPMRRRIQELDERVSALTAQLAATHQHTTALRAELEEGNKNLTQARRRLGALKSSSRFRLGEILAEGARHPGKAVVTVPLNLAKIWRARRARANAPKPPARPTHRTVTMRVPGSPERTISMTSPVSLLVPRKLEEDGLARYETSAIPCFLAAMDVAGPGAVLDIGANVGLYAGLAAAVTDRQVAAFEPFPILAEVAERFSTDNDLGFRVESIALGSENGSATLYLSDTSDSSNSLAEGFRKSTKQIEVPVETLDGWVRRTGLVPAVLKVDTESTEPDVLIGGAETLREHRPWILCEVLAGRGEDRLMEALAPHGYHWYHITDEVPYRHATVIEGDPSYRDLMWLFAPEPPTAAFWAAVTARVAAVAATDEDATA
jgi:FkbM family methyltransferase